jgi:hypothetical protein
VQGEIYSPRTVLLNEDKIMSYNKNEVMEVNGLSCNLNMPVALHGNAGSHNVLPPYCPSSVHVVDEYPACPDNWMHGSDIAGSYFVEVNANRGMWLDFNGCWDHSHHVAVLISIQGINPITDQKQDKMVLEQYRTKCPVHNVDFEQDLFCPECEYKWPAQNYISTTGTPMGTLWLDGFRSSNGEVLQYIFTEEEMKGIAAQIIGKDRVFAIGVAFFLSKEQKPPAATPPASGLDGDYWGHEWVDKYLDKGIIPAGSDEKYGSSGAYTTGIGGSGTTSSAGPVRNMMVGDVNKPQFFSPLHTPNNWKNRKAIDDSIDECITSLNIMDDIDSEVKTSSGILKKQKKLEIGGGAGISQQIHMDPEEPTFWQDDPSGFIYINYVTADEIKAILDGGKRKEKEAGALEGLNIGN